MTQIFPEINPNTKEANSFWLSHLGKVAEHIQKINQIILMFKSKSKTIMRAIVVHFSVPEIVQGASYT